MTATLGCMNGSISRGLVLCTVLVSLMASLVLAATPAYADGVETIASKQNQTENNACPYFIKTVMDTDWFSDRYTKRLEGIRASVALLVLDCPTTPVDMPVKALHEYQNISQDDSVSFMLGAAYEYGLHVQIDLDEARYWYKRFAFMTSGFSDEEIDKVRQRLFTFNPLIKETHDEKFDAALAEGKLASPLFEAEVATVRKLLSGPISGIIDASEYLYHGTNGYPQSTYSAKQLLLIAAQNGAPEAQYALAKAALDRRFFTMTMTRRIQLLDAQRNLTEAAKQHYLPAIKELAAFCEKYDQKTGTATAMALYLYAKREGAQDVDKHLRRLQQHWNKLLDWWLERSNRDIENEHFPICL